MSSIKFNTLVVFTADAEILDVLVGTDIGILSQLKETQHWDSMIEEYEVYSHELEEYSVQDLSDFYKTKAYNTSLTVRVSYFPDKKVFHR